MSGAPQTVDVIVVGAGMVGATAASLLARCGHSVAVVERRAPETFDPAAEVGLRVSAIAPGSARILGQAGAWKRIEAVRCSPYQAMHVEEAGRAGGLDFQAAAFGLDALGYIVENDLVQWALWTALESNPLVEFHCPGAVSSLEQDPDEVTVGLDDGTRLSAPLLIAADGAASPLRQMVGIRQNVWEYNQHGVVCVVRCEQPNPGVAWQRFMPGGPLAFLPLADGRSSIVWTRPAAAARTLLAADEEDFAAALGEASDGWLGRPEAVGPRAGFPLAMRLSEHYRSGRVVLLGDAAHAVHPLAGQGVNLGLADAAALVETLQTGQVAGGEFASPRQLDHWQRWRRSESELMAAGIHGLRALFLPRGLAAARALGLRLVGRSWLARDFFIRRAAGLSEQAPALARGATLKDLLRR